MRQNEVWLIDLNPTVGAEIKKIRPVVIVSDNSLGKLPLKVIVPITDWKERYKIAPWMVKIIADNKNGLSKDSTADCFQMRSVSHVRFVRKIGEASLTVMDEIRLALSKVLSITNEPL